MVEARLFYGLVTNNDDSTHTDGLQKGRIQVRLLPELKDATETLLPWADALTQEGMSANAYSRKAYTVGDSVWLLDLYDDNYKQLKIISGAFVAGLFDYESVETALDTISDITLGDYKNITFKLTPDGSIFFNNNVTGAMGIYHNTGNYVVFDATGGLFLSGSEIVLDTGDAGPWIPNSLSIDPFSGQPHGGTFAGINNLKGR